MHVTGEGDSTLALDLQLSCPRSTSIATETEAMAHTADGFGTPGNQIGRAHV